MTSEQRIAAEAIAFVSQFNAALMIGLHPDALELLEQMTGELIASVRAEAMLQCADLADAASGRHFAEIPNAASEREKHKHGAKAAMAMEMAAAFRALAKERKGEE